MALVACRLACLLPPHFSLPAIQADEDSEFELSHDDEKLLVEDEDDGGDDDEDTKDDEEGSKTLREVRLPEGEMGQELKRLCAAKKDVCELTLFLAYVDQIYIRRDLDSPVIQVLMRSRSRCYRGRVRGGRWYSVWCRLFQGSY
jgi:hypothetical protein